MNSSLEERLIKVEAAVIALERRLSDMSAKVNTILLDHDILCKGPTPEKNPSPTQGVEELRHVQRSGLEIGQALGELRRDVQAVRQSSSKLPKVSTDE